MKAAGKEHLNTEALRLIQRHEKELRLNSKLFGGVYTDSDNGCITVVGADNLAIKEIFRTAFVSSEYDEILDARAAVESLLEVEGIDVISAHDFQIALEEA